MNISHGKQQQQLTCLCVLGGMASDAEYFRERAAYCRELAESERWPGNRELLLKLASDFEEEAARLESDEADES